MFAFPSEFEKTSLVGHCAAAFVSPSLRSFLSLIRKKGLTETLPSTSNRQLNAFTKSSPATISLPYSVLCSIRTRPRTLSEPSPCHQHTPCPPISASRSTHPGARHGRAPPTRARCLRLPRQALATAATVTRRRLTSPGHRHPPARNAPWTANAAACHHTRHRLRDRVGADGVLVRL